MKKVFIIYSESELYVVEGYGQDKLAILAISGEEVSILQDNLKKQLSEVCNNLGEENYADIGVMLIYSKDMPDQLQDFVEELFRQGCKRLEIAMLEHILPTLLLKIGRVNLGEDQNVKFGNLYWNIVIDEQGKALDPVMLESAPSEVFELQVEDIPKAYLADFSFTSKKGELAKLTNGFDEVKEQLEKSNQEKNALIEKLKLYTSNLSEKEAELTTLKKRERKKESERKKEKKKDIESKRTFITCLNGQYQWAANNFAQVHKGKHILTKIGAPSLPVKSPTSGIFHRHPSLSGRNFVVGNSDVIVAAIVDPDDKNFEWKQAPKVVQG